MESASRAARYVTDGTVDVGHEFGLLTLMNTKGHPKP